MKKIKLLLFIVVSINSNAQKKMQSTTWIQERYVLSIDNKNDTLSVCDYLFPISGIDNPYGKLAIMRVCSDEMETTGKITKFNGKDVIQIVQFRTFLPVHYYDKKHIKDRDKIKAYVSKVGEKLVLQIVMENKILDEFYFVNHYHDYYFKGLRGSLLYLYDLKHNPFH